MYQCVSYNERTRSLSIGVSGLLSSSIRACVLDGHDLQFRMVFCISGGDGGRAGSCIRGSMGGREKRIGFGVPSGRWIWMEVCRHLQCILLFIPSLSVAQQCDPMCNMPRSNSNVKEFCHLPRNPRSAPKKINRSTTWQANCFSSHPSYTIHSYDLHSREVKGLLTT